MHHHEAYYFNVQFVMWQDVVDIMKESLYDKYVDEHGFVDFARSGGMSQQKEARRFLSTLNKESELRQKDCFSRTVSDVAIKPLSSPRRFNNCSKSVLFGRKIIFTAF
jgi:hypothetical protein